MLTFFLPENIIFGNPGLQSTDMLTGVELMHPLRKDVDLISYHKTATMYIGNRNSIFDDSKTFVSKQDDSNWYDSVQKNDDCHFL